MKNWKLLIIALLLWLTVSPTGHQVQAASKLPVESNPQSSLASSTALPISYNYAVLNEALNKKGTYKWLGVGESLPEPAQSSSLVYWYIAYDSQKDGYTLQYKSPGSDYFLYYLDINGDTGEPMLFKGKASGIYWDINCTGRICTIRNKVTGGYLDIDGESLTLSDQLYTGCYWRLY